jgi:hypothetical protein
VLFHRAFSKSLRLRIFSWIQIFFTKMEKFRKPCNSYRQVISKTSESGRKCLSLNELRILLFGSIFARQKHSVDLFKAALPEVPARIWPSPISGGEL